MNESKLLLSIIIPCRNGERWIPQVSESILTSDLHKDEYEIVFVNDASEDGTLEQMQLIASRFPNTTIVNPDTHLYLGGARNQGLFAAKGEYVWYVDADDMIVEKGCHAALHKAIDDKLDTLGFEYRLVDENGDKINDVQSYMRYETMDGPAFAKQCFDGKISYHLGYVTRFLYRRQFLMDANLLFSKGSCWEDTVFMPAAVIASKRICAIEDVLYLYRLNQGSICGTMRRQYPAQLIYDFSFVAGKDLLEYAQSIDDKQLSEELCQTATTKYINGFLISLLRTSPDERKAFYTLIRQNKERIEMLKPYMTGKSKLLLSPIFGKPIVELLTIGYKMKHRK